MPFTRRKNLVAVLTFIFLNSILVSFSLAQNNLTLDLSNHNPSSTHNYNWIWFKQETSTPASECTNQTAGLLVVVSGTLYICDGSNFKTWSDVWTPGVNNVYPSTPSRKIQIGLAPTPTGGAVKLYVAETHDQGTNNFQFKPVDQKGNAGLELTTSGTPSGFTRGVSYLDFNVGERGAAWNSRIMYLYDPISFNGMSIIAKRKTSVPRAAINYPDVKLYSNGNVDFGSDQTDTLLSTPRNIARKVKVYPKNPSGDPTVTDNIGAVKADKLILDTDGTGGNPKAEFKAIYKSSGYYAVYSPPY